jgi:hypothetical protein
VRRLLPAVALVALGCGAGEPGTGGFRFDLLVSRALADTVGEFQVALLQARLSPPCDELASTAAPQCLAARGLSDGSFVHLYDSAGAHRAIRFAFTSDATTTSGQALVVRADVSVDDLVVIEGLSRDATPQLLGTSCTPLTRVDQGVTTSLVANPMQAYAPSVACNPTM